MVRQSILMGFVGRSKLPGRPPSWLLAASDVRFVGLDGASEGDTILHFEAPTLGEAAADQYRQQEFWPSRPDANLTGFDLLGDVIADVADHRVDSDRFDGSLLKRLVSLERIFDSSYDRAILGGLRHNSREATVDQLMLDNARRLDSETPMPQRIRVVGTLDMIRMSSQGFELQLSGGSSVRGVLIEGEMASLVPLCGQRVLVQGTAIYRPSGRPLRIDATLVEAHSAESSLWSVIPPPRRPKVDLRRLHKPQSRTAGVSAFYGTWPGNESDEEWGEIVERIG